MTVTVTVHPNRYSTTGVRARKVGVVVHTTESGPRSLGTLVAKQARPGVRPVLPLSWPPRFYGSSYHAYADGSTRGYVELLPATAGPFSAPPANKNWWHISIPGWAHTTREQWLTDPWLSAQLAGVARFIADRWLTDRFPLELVNAADMRAGRTGICGHVHVTYAWRQSDHTDPGAGFPWRELLDMVHQLLTPTTPEEEDDMLPTLYYVTGANAVFHQVPNDTPGDPTIHVRWSGPGTPAVVEFIEALKASGVRERTVPATAPKAWLLHGPIPGPADDACRRWQPTDFAGIVP